MPLDERTGLIASMTGAATDAISAPARASAASSGRMSSFSLAAGVTAAIWTEMPASIASPTRCAPSSRIISPASPRAASRKRATSGFCRLVMVILGRIALWYDWPTHGGLDERSIDQEVRRRNPRAESRAEARAAEGNQARARAGRPARERGVPCREGAPAPRRIADQHAPEARVRDRAAPRRSHPEGSRRLRLDAPRRRGKRRAARLSTLDARGRQRRQVPHLHDVPERPRAEQQRAG